MQYNRSLDYLALAMNELRKGKAQLAARLLHTAANQPDAEKAIAIIEASNSNAFKPIQAKLEAAKLEASKATKTVAKQRLKAEAEEMEDEEVADEDMDQDPLDEVEDDEDEGDEVDDEVEASTVMAKTLQRMVRRG